MLKHIPEKSQCHSASVCHSLLQNHESIPTGNHHYESNRCTKALHTKHIFPTEPSSGAYRRLAELFHPSKNCLVFLLYTQFHSKSIKIFHFLNEIDYSNKINKIFIKYIYIDT